MYTAKQIAKMLTRNGIDVISSAEGDDLQDGEVKVTRKVHVQVPTFGGDCNVVAETTAGTFYFYPVRGYHRDLIDDVKLALRGKRAGTHRVRC